MASASGGARPLVYLLDLERARLFVERFKNKLATTVVEKCWPGSERFALSEDIDQQDLTIFELDPIDVLQDRFFDPIL